MIKVSIYSRVSSDYQDNPRFNRVSLKTQESICKEFIEKNKMKIDKTVSDVGSAGKMNKQDNLIQLLKGVKPGSTIVVYDISRFCRNLEFFHKSVLPIIKSRKLTVMSVDGFIYTGGEDTPKNLQFITQIINAEAELLSIMKRIQSSVTERKKNPNYRFGVPPYGFRAICEDGNRTFIEDEKEQEVIKYILYLHTEFGYHPYMIADKLTSDEIWKRNNYWVERSVKDVLVKSGEYNKYSADLNWGVPVNRDIDITNYTSFRKEAPKPAPSRKRVANFVREMVAPAEPVRKSPRKVVPPRKVEPVYEPEPEEEEEDYDDCETSSLISKKGRVIIEFDDGDDLAEIVSKLNLNKKSRR